LAATNAYKYENMKHTNGYPVALEARAELRDNRALTSMMQYSREFGFKAY
jgi:hypothetical protein